MTLRAFAFLIWCLTAVVAAAQDHTDRLIEVTQTERLLGQLAQEAMQSAQLLDQDFLGGAGGGVFFEAIEQLNDPERLLPKFKSLLAKRISDTQAQALLIFFDSPLGREIVDLEMSAREAMHDPDIEDMVRLRVAETGPLPLALRMIENGDLVERNVVDSLSSLRQFYLGQIAGGTIGLTRTDVDTMLAESEDLIRLDTQVWLESYLSFAYSPLSEDDLQTYVDMWETDTGRAYDDALFYAFSSLFDEIGFATGQLIARMSGVNEI